MEHKENTKPISTNSSPQTIELFADQRAKTLGLVIITLVHGGITEDRGRWNTKRTKSLLALFQK